MIEERFHELANAYFSDELDATGQSELASELVSNASCRKMFLDYYREHRLLDVLLRPQDENACIREIMEAIQPENLEFQQRLMKTVRRRALWRNRRGRIAVLLAAAACLAVAAGIFAWLKPHPVIAQVEGASSGCILHRKGQILPVARNQDVLDQDALDVPAGGTATITYSDGTRVDFINEARAVFQDINGAKHVDLNAGDLSSSIAKQPEGRPMIFKTPQAEAVVVGTHLALTVSAAATRLEVQEGQVLVTNLESRKSVDVKGGDFAVVSPDAELAARPMPVARPATLSIASRAVLRSVTGDGIYSLRFSSDDRWLLSGGGGSAAILWDTRDRSKPVVLRGHTSTVTSAVFTSDGKTVATGSFDKTIKLWSTQTGQLTRTLSGHSNQVWCVGFQPGSEMLASGSEDYSVKLWNIQTGRETATLAGHTGPLRALAFSQDGKVLATGGNDCTVRLWNPSTQALEATVKVGSNAVTSIAVSPDGATVAVTDWAGRLTLIDSRSGTVRKQILAHEKTATSVAYSGDGEIIATGSYDSCVSFWDAKSLELRAQHRLPFNPFSLAFEYRSRTLACGGGGPNILLLAVSDITKR